MIACLMLCATAAPARAALVRLDPGDNLLGQAVAGADPWAMPGAAAFNRLSRPIPIRFGFAEAGEGVDAAAGRASDLPAPVPARSWPPRSFQPADDPVILPDVPQSAGWMPLVGGLALVAYRIRRGNRRFRFRSAV